MNKNLAITIGVAVVCLLLGYALGNFLPLRNFSTTINEDGTQNIGNTSVPSEKGILKVVVKDNTNVPMVGIEVDVGLFAGPPEPWGVKEADITGTVSYELDPGTYYVFFNSNRFPQGYTYPDPQKVTLQKGETNEVSIVLQKS